MAAGDVVITGEGTFVEGLRLLVGTVVLDGNNPTPITLTNYFSTLLFGLVSLDGSVAPGDDPNLVTSLISGTTLNVYAWKNETGADPTYVASTDNSRVVDWIAIGTPPAIARV